MFFGGLTISMIWTFMWTHQAREPRCNVEDQKPGFFDGRSLRLSSFKKVGPGEMWMADDFFLSWRKSNTLMVCLQHETIIHESLRRACPNYVIQQLADSSSPGPLGLENDPVSTNLVKNTLLVACIFM